MWIWFVAADIQQLSRSVLHGDALRAPTLSYRLYLPISIGFDSKRQKPRVSLICQMHRFPPNHATLRRWNQASRTLSAQLTHSVSAGGSQRPTTASFPRREALSAVSLFCSLHVFQRQKHGWLQTRVQLPLAAITLTSKSSSYFLFKSGEREPWLSISVVLQHLLDVLGLNESFLLHLKACCTFLFFFFGAIFIVHVSLKINLDSFCLQHLRFSCFET